MVYTASRGSNSLHFDIYSHNKKKKKVKSQNKQMKYRVSQKKRSLAICALVDPLWHPRMIHRVEYQSKTLLNILFWLITLLFNLIAHSYTNSASPGAFNEVPSKPPLASASAFEAEEFGLNHPNHTQSNFLSAVSDKGWTPRLHFSKWPPLLSMHLFALTLMSRMALLIMAGSRAATTRRVFPNFFKM